MQVFVKLGDHFARAQAFAVGKKTLDKARRQPHQRQILLDYRLQIRPQHFYRHALAVKQLGAVHLRHRGAGHRRVVETGIDFRQRPPQRSFDLAARHFGGKRRDFVLQLGQFLRIGRRQQVGAGGEHLPQLDENRPQTLQRQPQPHRHRLGGKAFGLGQSQQQPAQPAGTHQADHQVGKAVAVESLTDNGKAGKPFHNTPFRSRNKGAII